MYSFRDVGTLVLTPSNANGGSEEGAEGDTAAAVLALPSGLDLSLAGESENDRDRQRLTVLVHREDPSAGYAEDSGLHCATSTCSAERLRG